MESEKNYKYFTDLEAWKAARKFKIAISKLVASFPAIEKNRLEDQLIRSSRSIGSNISEGYGRFTYKDQLRFCVQAKGSLYETVNHLIDAFDAKYITKETLIKYRQMAPK